MITFYLLIYVKLYINFVIKNEMTKFDKMRRKKSKIMSIVVECDLIFLFFVKQFTKDD